MIRVFIVAYSLALRTGLQSLLQGDPEIEITGDANNLHQALDSLYEHDVLVAVASEFPRFDEAISHNTGYSRPALLLLSDDNVLAPPDTRWSLRAWGILPVDASQEELIAAVHALHEGLLTVAPQYVQHLLSRPLSLPDSLREGLLEPLTGREIEVLQLMAQGLPNKQIALRLEISTHTVKFHVSSIYNKLGAANRTEAIRYALQKGLILL